MRARAVVMAGGSWTSRYVVKDLPPTHQAAYAQFHRSPCLVASVAVRNWRFLYDRGIHECRWFEGIGSYVAIRRVATFGNVAPTPSPDAPVVLTLEILFSYPGQTLAAQVARGRAELLSTQYREYERRIREQLTAVFGGSGPVGRIAFANSDLSGIMDHRASILEADRAVRQLVG